MRYFAVLFTGALVTSVGSGMTAFGLAIWMFRTTGTAASVGLVQACAFAPIVLLAPLAGTLADRYDRRILMLVGDGGSALGLAVIVAALGAARPSVPLILVGVTASSCLAAFTEPALRASVSDLLGPEEFVRASGMLQLAASAKFLLSPLLAGLLLAVTGLRTILLLDIATAGVTVVCTLVVLRAIGARPAPTARVGLVDELREGARIIAGRRQVVVAVAIMSVFTLVLGTLQTLIKPMLLPHHGVEAVGTAETICAVGMLLGAAVVALLRSARASTLLGVGIAGAGAGMLLTGLRPELGWVVACCCGVFVFLALCNAGAEVTVRSALPNEAQGRAWGIIGLVSQVGFLVAYAVAGPLTDRVAQPLVERSAAVAAVVGSGPGRGAALVISLLGLLALGLAPLARLTRLPVSKEDHAGAVAAI